MRWATIDWLLALALALSMSAGCSTARSPPPPPPSPPRLKIVSSLPRYGEVRTQTDSIVASVQMAVREAAPRLAGFVLEYEDWNDASPHTGDWDAGLEAANARRAIADPHPLVYLGPYNSGHTKVWLPLLNQTGLVMIAPTISHPGLARLEAAKPS